MADNFIDVEYKSLLSDPVLFFNHIVSCILCLQHHLKIIPTFLLNNQSRDFVHLLRMFFTKYL